MGSCPPGSVVFWDEEHPLPEGWEWMPLPHVGQYRLLFAKFLLTERCYRPMVKK